MELGSTSLAYLPPPALRLSQFLFSAVEYRLCITREFIGRGDVTNSAMQSLLVVMVYISIHDLSGLFQAQWRFLTNAFAFDGLMPPFDLAIALGVIRTRSDMTKALIPHEHFQIFSNKLGTVVGNQPWFCTRVFL